MTVRQEKWKVAKKIWKCSICDKSIHRGERYRYFEGKLNNRIYEYRFCERCGNQ